MPSSEKVFESLEESQTIEHGKKFAKNVLQLPCLILLEGPVGSGKTSWVRGFTLGYLKKKDIVTSPSYSLINGYSAGRREVVHVDLYRLKNQDDLESIGFWDLLEKKRVIIVEWGELIEYKWPVDLAVYSIKFSVDGQTKRTLRISARLPRRGRES